MTLTPTIGNDPRHAKLGKAKYDFVAFQLRDPESVLNGMTADEIAEFLEIAADAYYNKGDPLISDDLYDLAFEYLRAHYPDHPAGQRIGAPIVAGEKVELPYWMGSLDKIRDDPKALTKWLADYNDPNEYIISDKLDGNSGLLVYGKKTSSSSPSLYSRGDGEMGQNVSHLIQTIQGIVPFATLKKKTSLSLPLAVRGELIISRANWAQIKDLGANARNVVAGAMHAKQPDKRIASKIEFVAYELLEPRMDPLKGLELLKSLGFSVVDFKQHKKNDMTMDNLSEILVSRRNQSPYEIDGIVITHNKEYKRIKGKNPKYAFAFKSLLTHDEAEVIVSKVEWNVSKDGYIKPLVHFPTVVIEGAKISKATGFNAAFIEQNKIGPGSRIVVIRSGAVIPHIMKVLTPASNGKPAFPDVPYTWTATHVDIMMEQEEGKESAAMMMKRMEYFVNTLGIKSLGPGTIKKLFENNINTIPKLLAVKQEDIMNIDGFQSTSAKNIVEALSHVKDAKCVDLMAASGLFGRGIGIKKMTPVLEAFPAITDMNEPIPTYEQIIQIQGMGDVSAKAVLAGIVPFRKFLQEIGIPCNLKAKPQVKVSTSTPSTPQPQTQTPLPDMSNIVAVFTGFRNKDWEDKVAGAGGKITTSVSKNTTVIVAADPNEDSGKIKKAKELKITIMDKDDFAKKYNL